MSGRVMEGKIIKGVVEDLDRGHGMASVTIRSGKRIFSVLMPTSEVLTAGVELNREVFCMIEGKDITLFRDVQDFFRLYGQGRHNMEFHLPQPRLL